MLNVKVIESKEADDNVGAYIDSRIRSFNAIEAHPDFFNDKDHKAKVDEVAKIVKSFFRVHNGVYVSQRGNRGKPFTAVKVSRPQFPNKMTVAEKNLCYYKPLARLGVEVVFASGTNSWIYRVR